MYRNISVGITLTVIFILTGCAGGGSPAAPPSDLTNPPNSPSIQADTGSAYLWGLFDVAIDTSTETVEIVPLRGTELTVDVIKFLQPPDGLVNGLKVSIKDLSEYFTEGRMVLDVSLVHPFPGLDQFTGFDVLGVLIHEDGYNFMHGANPVSASDGLNSAILENADGYTMWMSPELFPSNGTIFTYTPGVLGTPDFPDPSLAADINGYKYFTDGLAPDESVKGFYSDPAYYAWRGKFSPGSTNIREYVIKFPMPGGSPLLHFQYAVIANWDVSDKTLSGDPDVLDVPGDFPMTANAREAFYASITDDSTTWYVNETTYGGDILFDLEIFNWHGVDGLGRIFVSSDEPIIPGGSADFDPSALVWQPGTFNSSVTTIEILDATPTSVFNQDIFIAIETNPTVTYDQGFGSPAPDIPLAGYFRHTLKVLNYEPGGDLVPMATATIEPYFDGFGPAGTVDDPIPTEWWLTLDASASTGTIDEYLWELSGDDLFDDASGMIVSAGFPTPGTHVVKLKLTDGMGGEAIYVLPGSYEVVQGTYVWLASPIDFNNGMRGAPWYFITDGILNAGGGGYVLVRGDDNAGAQCDYIADLTVTSDYSGIRIQGYYGDYATDIPPLQTGFVRVEADNVIVDGFEMTGPSGGLFQPYGYYAKIGADQADNVLFRHLYIHDLNGDLSAIICWFGGSLLVQNVLETQLNGFQHANKTHEDLEDPGPQMDMLNCTIDRAVETDGADIGWYVSSGGGTDFTPTIRNTIMTDCGNGDGISPAYFRRQGPFEAWAYYSCTSDTPEPPDGNTYYLGIDFGAGLIEDDPMYVDPYSNHHLQSGSPCENAGDPAITDYDDTQSDIGCYGGPYGDWDFES